MKVRVLALLLAMLVGSAIVWHVRADNPHGPTVVYSTSLAVTSSQSCCVTMVTPSADTDYIVTVYGTNTADNTVTFRLRWNDGVQNAGYNAGIGQDHDADIIRPVHVASGQSLSYYYDNGGGSGTTYIYITVVKE